jgi:hypothetical protein
MRKRHKRNHYRVGGFICDKQNTHDGALIIQQLKVKLKRYINRKVSFWRDILNLLPAELVQFSKLKTSIEDSSISLFQQT